MRFLACILALVAPLPAFSAERATYDSAGELTSIIQNGAELPVHGGLFAHFTGGLVQPLQPHDQRSPITRDGLELNWKGTATFPNATKADFTAHWQESATSLELSTSAVSTTRFPLDLESLDYVIDLPREKFLGGTFGDDAKALPALRPADPVFFRGTVDHLALADTGSWKIRLKLDQARPVTVEDHWDKSGRTYRIRIALHTGLLLPEKPVPFKLTIESQAQPSPEAAHLAVDLKATRYPFDGFGANYCFNTETPVIEYTLDQLAPAWVRFEFKAWQWSREQASPGPALKRDFELMQRAQKMNLPWVLSLWRLPERFYSDPNQKPAGTFGRHISAERWPEFLDLLGSYLVYLKKNYGAEPDLFSFNEPDLGVDIGFTGETHRDAIKRIGTHLASLGLKTKMLLGDTANPRDSHVYTLPTAADPEAMSHVGAVSFHSWGNGTPAQYGAWGAVGQWLNLPLIVGEAGVDPGSYRNKMFDSYAYGLREMQQYHELLRDSRPVSLLFWQYTEDYGLVRVKADKTLEPTGRFFLMKQFAALTPHKSEVVSASSDQPDVFVTAFVKGDNAVVHILNRGAERDATITGLPKGPWKLVTTTETEGFKESSLPDASGRLRLPARSMLALVK